MVKKEAMETLKNKISIAEAWSVLQTVKDPEIPVLSIVDLGIVRAVKFEDESDKIEVVITPTYSGCPAMDVISMSIRMEFMNKGYTSIKISQQLSPPWTTDWMTDEGKQKLKEYGIAPPVNKVLDSQHLQNLCVPCPQCNSYDTHLVSEFGSTACKALFQCDDCKEPFDYFKCH